MTFLYYSSLAAVLKFLFCVSVYVLSGGMFAHTHTKNIMGGQRLNEGIAVNYGKQAMLSSQCTPNKTEFKSTYICISPVVVAAAP